MNALESLYRPSLALLTDLYQLTMAHAHWKTGSYRKEAVFHLYFRNNPFGGGFTVACGLTRAKEFLSNFRFEDNDLLYLRTLLGEEGARLFDEGFIEYLRELTLECDIDAVDEGRIVFPGAPLVRVRGPIIAAQLIETPLLNVVNFETLIATKAARMAIAARGDPVMEFGLRRAQGIDGALAASRAAYIGGCSATSNVLAGKLFGIPVKGTHSHSWVMAFGSEMESFEQFAKASPGNCVFLVDTFHSLDGIAHAIEVGKTLKAAGHRLGGIRLDSGDLAYLSIEARRMLDEAGFPDAAIVASNELDENIITSLREQGARVSVWGVGTRLITGHDQAAMGCVYKLSAVRDPGGPWHPRMKLSEQAAKVSNPGIQQVRRFSSGSEFAGDMIWHEDPDTKNEPSPLMIDPLDMTRRRVFTTDYAYEDLLKPIFRKGVLVCEPEPLAAVRDRVAEELSNVHGGIKRFVNPHVYPVGLEESLFKMRSDLMLRLRNLPPDGLFD
ncbi:MAG: nicotinate phosphoribosyltransferase [Vicinamibacteria bacterium]|nr:nicotinate phosphoribosyltransferase [Vicinamibacteria bacterium]